MDEWSEYESTESLETVDSFEDSSVDIGSVESVLDSVEPEALEFEDMPSEIQEPVEISEITEEMPEPAEYEEVTDYYEETEPVDEDVKVLKRDEGELWAEGNEAISNNLEVLRDDLRDKGLEDGPEMEQLIEAERVKLEGELAHNIEGDLAYSADIPEWQQDPSVLDSETDSISEIMDNVETEDTEFAEDEVEGIESVFEEEPEEVSEVIEEEYENIENEDQEEYEELEDITEDELEQTVESFVENEDIVEDTEEITEDVEQDIEEQEESDADIEIPETDENEDLPEIAEETETLAEIPVEMEETDDVSRILDSVEVEEQEFEPEINEVIEAQDEPDEIKPIDEIGDWLEDINPNFDPFDTESPYCNNCGSCAYAVYSRLEGNKDICATAENIGYNDEMEALTGMEQISISPEEIQERLLEAGEGAHAIIGIDRAEGPGHWFNAANIDGKVVAIDGQTGEINDWPPDYGDVINWEMSIKKEDM